MNQTPPFHFVLSKLSSPYPKELKKAYGLASAALRALDRDEVVNLADLVLEGYRGHYDRLLSHFPELLESFLDWWEAEEAAANDDYRLDNPRDRLATGTTVGALGRGGF